MRERQHTDGNRGAIRDVAEEAREAAREQQGVVRERTAQVKNRVREKTSEFRGVASERADRLTSTLGDRVERVARALRTAADALEDEGEGRMSAMSIGAAETVERFSGYLRDENPGGMLKDLEGMARRNPAVFIATTFAAGLLVGRFFRAGEPSRRSEEYESTEAENFEDGRQEATGYTRRVGDGGHGGVGPDWEGGI